MGASLESFKVIGSQVLSVDDGDYQIDVTAQFEALEVNFLVLIECKHHSHPIKRDVAMLAKAKKDSLGAHKAMIFSTAEFQSGTVRYAKKHGIALIHVQDARYSVIMKSSSGPQPQANQNHDGWFVFIGEDKEEEDALPQECLVVDGNLFLQPLIMDWLNFHSP